MDIPNSGEGEVITEHTGPFPVWSNN